MRRAHVTHLTRPTEAPLVSVVISTYNRARALATTLGALADQDLLPERYEVLVVDDGSSDDTPSVLASLQTPYDLRTFRAAVNLGVSAGRNVGLRAARGRYVILLSDDLVVSASFITMHVHTLERFERAWVVGGFAQLADLTATPFGRYLSLLEKGFEAGRTAGRVEENIWEMHIPTARNLSMPRADLERVGLFDEQFRVTCEDQDLAERARSVGIRFLYAGDIQSVHNDHAANLERYCSFQELGAIDSVRLFRKHPSLVGPPLIRLNGRINRRDRPATMVKKIVKLVLARRFLLALIRRAISIAELAQLPDELLFRAYRGLIGLYIFRGWRTGLREVETGVRPSR